MQNQLLLKAQCHRLAGVACLGVAVNDNLCSGLPEFEKAGEQLLPVALVEQDGPGDMLAVI